LKTANQESTEAALIKGLQAGSADAFRAAVNRYAGPMLATARAIAGPAHAEDIVQDAWIKVFQQIGKFEVRSSLSTWLQRIVANGAISMLRKSQREVTAADFPEGSAYAENFDATGHWSSPPPDWHTNSPDGLLTAEELQDCLETHLERMPENQRAVLAMRDMQGLSFEDVCGMLELTPANARVLLHRARLKLMTMVDHFERTGTC
jgi:RNA polymerase sigma-70 factor (ECF subfamily)